MFIIIAPKNQIHQVPTDHFSTFRAVHDLFYFFCYSFLRFNWKFLEFLHNDCLLASMLRHSRPICICASSRSYQPATALYRQLYYISLVGYREFLWTARRRRCLAIAVPCRYSLSYHNKLAGKTQNRWCLWWCKISILFTTFTRCISFFY